MRCVPQNSSFSATRGHSMRGDCRRFPFLADLLRVDCRSGCRSRGHTGGRTWSCAWLMLTSMGRRGTSGGAVCRERDRCGDGRLRPSGVPGCIGPPGFDSGFTVVVSLRRRSRSVTIFSVSVLGCSSRDVGSSNFVAGLEALTSRSLAPRKGGRPKKPAADCRQARLISVA